MTTLDQLRQALEDRATQAPDGAGLVRAAQAGAARIRRRRRITRLTLAAGLVLAIAVGTPVGLHLRAAPRPVDAAVPDRHPRTVGERTLTTDPAAHAVEFSYGSSASGQTMHVSVTTPAGEEFDAQVVAYDSGTVDSRFGGRPAKAATVRGLPARSRIDSIGAELLWRDPGGSVVSVTHYGSKLDLTAAGRAALQQIAEAVRFAPPSRIKTPIRFGTLRDGLSLSGITVTGRTRTSMPPYVVITLTYPNSVMENRRQVDVTTSKIRPDPARGGFKPVAAVGAHPAWFKRNGRRDQLLLESGPCGVEFLTSPGMTERQVRDLAGEAQLLPCDQPETWNPPVG